MFCNIHKKKTVFESLFYKAARVLSCDYCEIFINSFFYRTSLVAVSACPEQGLKSF